jgi:hypothetical protein
MTTPAFARRSGGTRHGAIQMANPAPAIGVGHCLQRRRAQGHNDVDAATDDFARDGVDGGQVGLGVVPGELDAIAGDVASLT